MRKLREYVGGCLEPKTWLAKCDMLLGNVDSSTLGFVAAFIIIQTALGKLMAGVSDQGWSMAIVIDEGALHESARCANGKLK